MAQVEPFLEFDDDYIFDQYDQTEAYYKKSGQKKRPWSFGEYPFPASGFQILIRILGKIYRSMTGIVSISSLCRSFLQFHKLNYEA